MMLSLLFNIILFIIMAFSAASNPAYTVSRLGQNNLTGDVRDLFLKLYAGEVN